MRGLPVCLLDTGLRRPNKVEELGMRRTRQHLSGQTWCFTWSTPASLAGRGYSTTDSPHPAAHLTGHEQDRPAGRRPSSETAGAGRLGRIRSVKLRARGAGLPALKEAIFSGRYGKCRTDQPSGGDPGASPAASGKVPGLSQPGPGINQGRSAPELLALELQAGAQELGAILGLELGEEVLDRIFRVLLGK